MVALAIDSMDVARERHTAIALSAQSKVLIAGGAGANKASLTSSRIYDAYSNQWSNTGALPVGALDLTLTTLFNGSVLAVGGYPGQAMSAIYSTDSGTWSPGPTPPPDPQFSTTGRGGHTATYLNNGKVLIAGGATSSGGRFQSAQLFTLSNTWSSAAPLIAARAGHSASLLSTGRVLVAGGSGNAGTLASTEIYGPLDSWVPKAALTTARSAHTGTTLTNGNVLVVGGFAANGTALATAELYDPTKNAWGDAKSLSTARGYHAATLLGDGRVLVSGGLDGAGNVLASTEVYEPITNSWSTADSMITRRVFHTATLLNDNSVLIAGGDGGPVYNAGNSALASAERFAPPVVFRLSGRITKINGAPLAGCSVQIAGRTTTTGTNGGYAFDHLPPGTYVVHPSLAGFTFGSPAYEIAHRTVTLSASSPSTVTVDATGYDRQPIVYVHGWLEDTTAFSDTYGRADRLPSFGYASYYVSLVTSEDFTPHLIANAEHVGPIVNQALYETGQDQVKLVAHSMGGLVARVYLESAANRSRVSEIFTFGTPHQGIPPQGIAKYISAFYCGTTQPGVCDMQRPAMNVFNTLFKKVPGVIYHEIGGDAPMTMQTKIELVCIEKKHFKFCWPVAKPYNAYRNSLAIATGFAIPGPDDAFIETCSTIGEPTQTSTSLIDRRVTHEVHDSALGPRTYYSWEDAPSGTSAESYDDCLERVLVHGAAACGDFSAGTACPSYRMRTGEGGLTPSPSPPITVQRAAPFFGTVSAEQTISRNVIVEGGDTRFSIRQTAGSGSFTLVDPTGQIVDPAYVASITVPASPSDPVAPTAPQDLVIYNSEGGASSYYFPNAMPGVWQLVLHGNDDIPAGGTGFTSEVIFDSTFVARLDALPVFVTPGTNATFNLSLSPVASASVAMSVVFADGTTTTLTPVSNGGTAYSAAFAVPNLGGYAQLRWSASGARTDGTNFERGGVETVQIASTAIMWGGVQGESTPARANDASLHESLIIDVRLDATYAGAALLSGDLVDGAGHVVAHANQATTVSVGANTVALSFDGDDIYGSAFDGPYRLTNVAVLDARDTPVFAAALNDVHQTSAYVAGSFARNHGTPSVTTTGPYSARSGESVQLGAIGVDPEAEAITLAWDLDGDGVFETSGPSPNYIAPSVSALVTTTVRVRATDPGGSFATAQTSIDVSPMLPGDPTDDANHVIELIEPSGSNQGHAVTLSLPSSNRNHVACGYAVALNASTAGGLAGGPSNWRDVVILYNAAAGCAASCPSGVADTVMLVPAYNGGILSSAEIAAACPGLSANQIQNGQPGTSTLTATESISSSASLTVFTPSWGTASTLLTVAGATAVPMSVPATRPWVLAILGVSLLSIGAELQKKRNTASLDKG